MFLVILLFELNNFGPPDLLPRPRSTHAVISRCSITGIKQHLCLDNVTLIRNSEKNYRSFLLNNFLIIISFFEKDKSIEKMF